MNSGCLSLDGQLMMVVFKHDGGSVGLVHVEFFFFLMWTIFKVFIELLRYCFYFMFWCFGYEAYGILVPRPGMEPASPALEGEV